MSANDLPRGRRYYKTSDIKRITGYSERTVERMAERGTLPAIRVKTKKKKGNYLFPIAMTDRVLENLLPKS